MQEVFLGIDTSCYTTSVALLDVKGNLLADERRLLTVGTGGRGLRQSEMVFQHTKNLPVLLEKTAIVKTGRLAAIGVSAQPRTREDSYMPAFITGLGTARSLAAATGAKLCPASHQENHIEAGLWAMKSEPCTGRFIVLHASGGTTDLLLAEKNGGRLLITELGGSKDLNAGQFIDRIGVVLGLSFPAGPHLERLAAQAVKNADIPVAVKGLALSFSGPLTAALRLLDKGTNTAELASGVQKAIADSIAKLLLNAAEETGCRDILLVGGVLANKYIRTVLEEKLGRAGNKTFFPEAAFCGDNAVGCASIALREWRDSIG